MIILVLVVAGVRLVARHEIPPCRRRLGPGVCLTLAFEGDCGVLDVLVVVVGSDARVGTSYFGLSGTRVFFIVMLVVVRQSDGRPELYY